MNIRRYPTRSPSRPAVTMPLAYMNAYPPTINCRAASLTCRSRCSDGAATFTTQMSKPAKAGLVTKRIQGARGYTQLRKEDVDRRFPGLLDSVLNADDPALV
ncbi:MAG TPA: hypothetical protein VFO01_11540 [Trebonia sp.]|nr:hypothetical protein [Trebonia sp.]